VETRAGAKDELALRANPFAHEVEKDCAVVGFLDHLAEEQVAESQLGQDTERLASPRGHRQRSDRRDKADDEVQLG
jgi:hypothetical protein